MVHAPTGSRSVQALPPRPGRCTFLFARSAFVARATARPRVPALTASCSRRRFDARYGHASHPPRAPSSTSASTDADGGELTCDERARAQSICQGAMRQRCESQANDCEATCDVRVRCLPANTRVRWPILRGSASTMRRAAATTAGRRTKGASDRSRSSARRGANRPRDVIARHRLTKVALVFDPPPVNSPPGRTNTRRRWRSLPRSRRAR